MLESNPLKPTILVWRSAADKWLALKHARQSDREAAGCRACEALQFKATMTNNKHNQDNEQYSCHY